MLLHPFVGAIVVDTVCFSVEAARATEKDHDVVARLEELLPEINRQALFEELVAAKADVSGLGCCLNRLVTLLCVV